jgi:hypothetical protein
MNGDGPLDVSSLSAIGAGAIANGAGRMDATYVCTLTRRTSHLRRSADG